MKMLIDAETVWGLSWRDRFEYDRSKENRQVFDVTVNGKSVSEHFVESCKIVAPSHFLCDGGNE